MAFVRSCPTTEAEFFKASERMGCDTDTNGHDQYICIPNEQKTSLVEFCYNEVMGIREKGIAILIFLQITMISLILFF